MREAAATLRACLACHAAGILAAVIMPLCVMAGTNDAASLQIAAARNAIHDELYTLATTKLEACLGACPTGAPERAQAALLLADVYELEGRFDDMATLLDRHESETRENQNEPAWQAARAVADAGAGRAAAALRRITDIEERFSDTPAAARARRLRGWCLLRLGRLDEALAAFQTYDSQSNSPPDTGANRLEWSRALLGAGRIDEAATVLEKPGAWPASGPLAMNRRLALAELAAARHEDARAASELKAIADSRSVTEPIRAAALFLLSDIMARQTNATAALEAIRMASTHFSQPAFKNEANLREGLLLLRLGRPEEGMPWIRAFVSANTTNAPASGVQLALARMLLERGMPEQAAAEYQHYLEAFSDPEGALQAMRGRGWALYQLGRFSEALEVFRKGRALASAPADLEWFQTKLADTHLANRQFQLAGEAYRKALKDFPASPQADLFRFQAAECSAMLGEEAVAKAEFMDLAETSATPGFRERALLRAANLTARQGRFLEALELYRDILEKAGTEAAQAGARHGMGLMQYRLGRFKEALANFSRVVSDSPAHDSADHALIMAAWCRHMLGDSDKALASFRDFMDNYPESTSTPNVLFWMGEILFNMQNHAQAEKRFTELAQRFPDSAQAPLALFWAARAAFMNQEYLRANKHIVALLRQYPKAAIRAEARYCQAEALCEIGDFSAAILLYDEIIKQFPDHAIWNRVWCRKGDCQYTLGAEDPRRYEEAIASYQVVLDRTEAPQNLRLHAEYGIARCMDKLGRREKAFERYMGVVYKYLETRERNTPECDVWFTRAAFQAAEMKESEKSWRAAVNLYQRIVDARVPAAPDAEQRIKKIKAEQWTFFH